MAEMKFKTYAIDFDDTITINTKFPEIGELNPYADRVIRRIKENGGEIAIWTCRTGEHVERVKRFLSDYNIPYDSFNEILPSEREQWGEGGRKIFAHCYIDDKGLYAQMNGGIDWLQIENFIFGDRLNHVGMITSATIDASKITLKSPPDCKHCREREYEFCKCTI